jgi:excisionase family DNA binding protein
MGTIPVAKAVPSGKIAVSTDEAADLAGIGRTTIYEAIRSGDLKSLKIGRRRLIRVDALHDWLAELEAAP